MKEIIINKLQGKTIDFVNVNPCAPIFAKLEGRFAGMIVKEDSGWILRTGRSYGASGYHTALIDCIESCVPAGYTFFVN